VFFAPSLLVLCDRNESRLTNNGALAIQSVTKAAAICQSRNRPSRRVIANVLVQNSRVPTEGCTHAGLGVLPDRLWRTDAGTPPSPAPERHGRAPRRDAKRGSGETAREVCPRISRMANLRTVLQTDLQLHIQPGIVAQTQLTRRVLGTDRINLQERVSPPPEVELCGRRDSTGCFRWAI
jgi:hypothetical protein